MTPHVLDLGGEVVADVGKLDVQLAHQLERVPRPVEEVGIAEGDVACPGLDQATDVLEYHTARYREEAAAVDRRGPTKEARVGGAAAPPPRSPPGGAGGGRQAPLSRPR